MVYQSLEDLKAACMEAAEGDCKVEDFEVGVFSGNYMTCVPENYFEHLSQLRRGKNAQSAANGLTTIASENPAGNAVVVANSGPVNVVQASGDSDAGMNRNNVVGPEYEEDIRLATFQDAAAVFTTN